MERKRWRDLVGHDGRLSREPVVLKQAVCLKLARVLLTGVASSRLVASRFARVLPGFDSSSFIATSPANYTDQTR